MVQLLYELSSKYSVVLVTAPPVLAGADAPLLAALADGLILVVRPGATTVDQLQRATDRLSAVHARLIGVVVDVVLKGRAAVRA
jgi:Mrp family chromosome partitioning ATPase